MDSSWESFRHELRQFKAEHDAMVRKSGELGPGLQQQMTEFNNAHDKMIEKHIGADAGSAMSRQNMRELQASQDALIRNMSWKTGFRLKR